MGGAATGAERWRRELGALAECGPAGGTTEPGSRLVCLGGPPDDRTVTVLRVDGTVLGTRGLGAVESAGTKVPGVGSVEGYDAERFRWSLPSVWPAADGALVVLEPGEVLLSARSRDEARRALAALSREDLPTLRVVDAVTGEVRGSVTPRLRTLDDLAGCGGGGQDWVVDLQQPAVGAFGPYAWMSVCGTPLVLGTDGEPVVRTETGVTVLREGERVELPGPPLRVRADDGSSDTAVSWTEDGSVVGTAPDGPPRWTAGLDLALDGRGELGRAAGTVPSCGAWRPDEADGRSRSPGRAPRA